jgi:hypothetical protein
MKKVLLTAGVLLLPSIAGAQQAQGLDVGGLTETVQGLTRIVNYAIPFFLGIAVIAFIIGVIRFLFAATQEKREEAKHFLLWGVISITVILAVFGIARVLINLFGLSPGTIEQEKLPGVPERPING